MNVVGKVGSFITQGVYSVATPFHPFGGAVDIIVVQQQDGSFRSTPWYVQFGKFQGVLKGAEKMVRINVNGVEADFHMFLDNSGEAYFVRDADLCQDSEKDQALKDEREGALEHSLSVDNSQCNINNDNVENYRLQSTLSDPGIMRDDFTSFGSDRLERTDSDVCRFYDFQDDQFDGELSPQYESGRYDNLDVENFVEAQGSDSEMVLVSVDGHILTAPISSTEQTTENVQLDTPQFHLGPGESDGFCKGDTEFTVRGSTWDSAYIDDIGTPADEVASVASCDNNNSSTHESPAADCEVEGLAHHIQTRDDLNKSEPEHEEETSEVNPSETYQVEGDNDGQGEEDGDNDGQGEEDGDNDGQDEGVGDNDGQGEEDGDNDGQGEEDGDTHNMDSVNKNEEHVHEGDGLQSMHVNEQSEEAERTHQDHDNLCINNQEVDLCVASDAEDVSPSIKNEKFKSCLDLTKVAMNECSEGDDDTITVQEEDTSPEQKHVETFEGSNFTEIASDSPAGHSVATLSNPESESTEGSRSIDEDVDSECTPTANTSLDRDEQTGPSVLDETAKINVEDFVGTESDQSELLNAQSRSSSEQGQANINPRLEISLCRHLLHPGMGLDAANEVFNLHRLSEEEYKSSAVSAIKNDNLVIRYKEKYLPWDQAAPIVLGVAAFGSDLSIESKDVIPVEQDATPKSGENDSGSASGRRWRLWRIPFRRVKTIEHSNSGSSDEVFVDPESVLPNSSVHLTPSESGTPRSVTSLKSPHKKILRTNIPTNEQIESLNLKEGQNDVTFSFSTRVLGVQQVEAHIYLWKWNARIVISDVDGTITKSDVLGQFMPLVGKDWSQSGVAHLFTAIKENGYQLLFLSARAIVQAYLTKSFLFNLKQDGKTLPNGPVVISPNGLFPSLFREVIRRAPHEFKIACLEDIKALFPADYNPFYAGFGNRDTDELTYRKIGIPKGKIFIINPKGEVAINHRIDVKSYTSLHTLVHDMFPPTNMVEQEDYNHWNYWKIPLPDIDD